MIDGMGNYGWGTGFGFIFMLLFWALIIFGIIAIVKWIVGASGDRGAPTSQSARAILDARYARGEIDSEEYERKKRDLEQ